VADALVSNVCCFGTPRDLHSDHSQNFEFELMREVLTPGNKQDMDQPSSSAVGMVEHCVKMVEEHLRMVISSPQRDWDERLLIFLLAYRASSINPQDHRYYACHHGVQEGATPALRPLVQGSP
jgi:hypothetical protein